LYCIILSYLGTMSPSSTSSSSSSSSSPQSSTSVSATAASSSLSRINNIASHISPTMASATNFPAEVVPQAPEDALFGLMRAYRADESPDKVDLGIGAYRDDNAKPWVLPVVKKADEVLRNDPNLDHEYAPIAGIASFTSKAAELILGADSPALKEKRATSVQTISGTGAVHLGALFLAKFYKGTRTVYVSNPTWANHHQIFSNVGISVAEYPYFSKETRGLDFEGMKSAIQAAPNHSIILLHPCAHNPTGVDPTMDQWKELAEIIRNKSHFPFFDCAYQGFASGDLNRDASAVRYFVEQGHNIALCQSFAKNMGLYGERIGAFSMVCADADEKKRVDSQLKILIRPLYSNPPIHGARIAAEILNSPTLYKQWLGEVKEMADRIITMRALLKDNLEKLGSKHDWSHITSQIGMFAYTGLTAEEMTRLAEEFSVYATKDGRISVAGITSENVGRLAEAIYKVKG
jgi:aspartate/tyrosine/aromatic aminotransferase